MYRAMTQQNNNQDQKLYILSELLALSERAASASIDEVRFMCVNETHKLISYEQAGLWENQNNQKPQLTALSGAPIIDRKSPYADFLNNLYASHFNTISEVTLLDAKNSKFEKQWTKHLANHAIFLPLKTAQGQQVGTIFFSKSTPWQDDEAALLTKFTDIYANHLSQKQINTRNIASIVGALRASKKKYWLTGAAALLLLYPIPSSVLAPAEITAKKPELVRSPLEGIISSIAVEPNQNINKGDLLFSYDLASFIAQKELSEKALSVAEKELRQTTQEALNDPRARVRLARLKGSLEKEKTNLEYYQSVVERGKVFAPSNGTVIFEDVYDWVGRPVSVGERIMLLARPDHTQLEIQLPANEAIEIKADRPVLFFSDARPDIPLKATLSYHSYKANKNDHGDIAYRLKAEWVNTQDNQDLYRLGHKGTVKIYGPKTPLLIQILRKPIIFMRQIMGI